MTSAVGEAPVISADVSPDLTVMWSALVGVLVSFQDLKPDSVIRCSPKYLGRKFWNKNLKCVTTII
jgi:hypothetical protein